MVDVPDQRLRSNRESCAPPNKGVQVDPMPRRLRPCIGLLTPNVNVLAVLRLTFRRISGRLTDGLTRESGPLDSIWRKFLSGVCFTSGRCRPGVRMVIGNIRPISAVYIKATIGFFSRFEISNEEVRRKSCEGHFFFRPFCETVFNNRRSAQPMPIPLRVRSGLKNQFH